MTNPRESSVERRHHWNLPNKPCPCLLCPPWRPALLLLLSLADDGIWVGILGHLRELFIFPWVSPMYTWSIHVNKLVFLVCFYFNFSLQGSQPRAQSRGKIIFPPLQDFHSWFTSFSPSSVNTVCGRNYCKVLTRLPAFIPAPSPHPPTILHTVVRFSWGCQPASLY